MQQTPAPSPAAEAEPTANGSSLVRAVFSTHGELYGAILAGALLLVGAIGHWTSVPHADVLIWASLGIGSLFGGRAALQSLAERKFDIDVLMIVGAGLAAYLGHPAEGALLLFLFTLSGALEDLAMQRTRREVEALHKLMPVEAIALRDGEWKPVPPESLAAGEHIKIRPGDRVPTDCRVLMGSTEIDQSAITGESVPRFVVEGNEIYAGTINVDDPIEAVVLRPAAESSLQKILTLVTQAREQREPVQRTIDRLSQPYAIGVMALSAAVLLVWWLVIGQPFKDAAYTAITLLIVASPCALVIATPTATLAAIARAARAGVLFKGGQAIERLAHIGSVAFDKTGTLTFGRPKLYEAHPVAWSDGPQLLAMAAGLEAESTHPIAAAVREAATERGIVPAAVTDIDHTAGRGVAGRFHGCPVRLGSYKHTEELIPVCFRNRVQEVLAKIQERGHLGVVVTHACPEKAGGGEAAVLIMADAVRPGARTLVDELHGLGVKPVRMLTGDNPTTAERVATMLGLDQFDAELLPEDKVAAVRQMKADQAGRARSGVAVIGDGVNDAPALAMADVAIAIGSIGSDAALESADIVLLSDDLAVVPWAVRLARAARRKVRLNLAFALSIIGLMAIATLAASLTPHRVPLSLGVLAHEGGTLLVVVNSLMLLGTPGVVPGVGRSEKSRASRPGTTVSNRQAMPEPTV